MTTSRDRARRLLTDQRNKPVTPETRAALDAAFAEYRGMLAVIPEDEIPAAVAFVVALADDHGFLNNAVTAGVLAAAERVELRAYAAEHGTEGPHR